MGAAIFPTRPWGPPSSRESLFEKRGTHRQTLRYQCAARCTRNTTEPCSRDPAAASECPLAHRRHVLQAASAGAMYSLAGRLISSADSASATSPTSSLDSLARQLEERVHEFTLANGMRFIVSERRAAPVVSFHTYADVGAYDEVEGQTGVAHFLEHLAFKGTPRVGTRDFVKEAPLLDAMDEAFYSLKEASTPQRAAALSTQLDTLQAQAAAISVPNAYGALLQREGAVGLNAATTHDSTKYYVSLPKNKLELWFALESERFQAPVFREVYSEKKVVLEERRLRVDNAPLGAFQEQFAQASLTNNYRRPVIGYEADIQGLGRREVASFFAQHYGPSALTVSIAGDVRPEEVRALAEKYFGRWRSAAVPGEQCTPAVDGLLEPLPLPVGRRELTLRSSAGPAVMLAWYRPCIRSLRPTVALDMLDDTLTGSRLSRLYRSLVLGGKALAVTSFSSFPAEKHAAQMVVYAIPVPGQGVEAVGELVKAEVGELLDQGPTEQELLRYTKAARMGVLGVLQSNSGLAATLAAYQVLRGDWREVCAELERIKALTPGAVRDAAAPYLTPQNCFMGYVLPA